EGGSAGWVTGRAAGRQAVCAESDGLPSLDVITLAVLSYDGAQFAVDVGAVTCTVRVAPEARSIGCPARVSCWLPSAPDSANAPGFPGLPSSDKCTGPGVPPGSRSVRVTPCAVPVPPLWIAAVNPICSPPDTDGALARRVPGPAA